MTLTDLVDQAIHLMADAHRGDLRRRLEQTRERLANPEIRVIVVGEFKQGKSQLINALVGAPVCPVDDDIATSVPTIVRFGDAAEAFIVRVRDDGEGRASVTERTPVALDQLAAQVSESGNPGNRLGITVAEVALPRTLLSGGLAVIDSPGVGGLDSPQALTTMTALPSADAMLFVSDASQEYTEPEIQFLRQALRITPTVACVLSKTDLYPPWRRVAELNRGHLDGLGLGIPLICTSSQLRLHAGRLKDPELNDESGFPELIAYLRGQVLGHAQQVQQRSVSHDLLSVTEQVRLSMQSELTALIDPSTTPAVIAELEAAKERTDELRRRSSRWQITLNDGIGDLMSDIEHDLRERMRSIQREAEDAIDKGDPAPVWDQLVDWLEQRVAAAVSDTFVWTNERSAWLSRQIAEHFAADAIPLPTVRIDDTEDVLEGVDFVPDLDPGHLGPLQKMLIGMRGSYGGVLMFGLLTGIIGLSLINPFSLAAGVVIGSKSYRDDKENRLKRRQSEAKSLIRRQLDDVVFHVGKQLKDRLRMVGRATRDHFTELADEQHRSLAESVLAAQKAATLFSKDRDERMAALKTGMARVDALRAQVPGRPAAQPPAPALTHRLEAERAAQS